MLRTFSKLLFLSVIMYSGVNVGFSLFSIVRFPNLACTSTDGQNGTCYSTQECVDSGGTSVGSCAGGFGVCCQANLTKSVTPQKN